MLVGCIGQGIEPDDTNVPVETSNPQPDVTIHEYVDRQSIEVQRRDLGVQLHFSPDKRYYLMTDAAASMHLATNWIEEVYLFPADDDKGEHIFHYRDFFGLYSDRASHALTFFWGGDSRSVWMHDITLSKLYRYSLATGKWEEIDHSILGRPICFLWEDTMLIDREDGFAIYDMAQQESRLLPPFYHPYPISDISGEYLLLTKYVPLGEGHIFEHAVLDTKNEILTEINLPPAEHNAPSKGIVESEEHYRFARFYPNTPHIISYINMFIFRGLHEGDLRETRYYLVLYNLKTGKSANLYLGEWPWSFFNGWNVDGTGFMGDWRYMIYLDMEKVADVVQ